MQAYNYVTEILIQLYVCTINFMLFEQGQCIVSNVTRLVIILLNMQQEAQDTVLSIIIASYDEVYYTSNQNCDIYK